jgi:hypothetical protein
MIREPSRSEQQVTEAVRRYTVRAGLSAKVLSTETVSVATIEKWQKGDKQPTLAKVRDILAPALREDPRAALEFLTDALGLADAGLVLALMPKATSGARDVEREAAEASLAASDVQRAVLTATADGHVSPDEARVVRYEARRAQRELVELTSVVERYELAQGSFPVAEAR